MRRKGDVRTFAVRGDHVAGAIDGSGPSERLELLLEPCGTLLFEEGGRRHAAELQMDFVDPLLLAREPLQALAHTAVVSQFSDVEPRRRVCGHTVVLVYQCGPDRPVSMLRRVRNRYPIAANIFRSACPR